MRRPVIAFCSGAILSALLSTSISPAHAEPTPSPSPSASIDAYRALLEQFKRDRDAFAQALQERDLKMRLINATFKSAVDKATADAKIALTTATTPEQKSAIASTRRSAVAAAIAARDTAISALGPLPTPPVRPEKLPFDPRGKQKR